RRARRIVQSLVDLAAEHEALLVGLARGRSHAANDAILAIALGARAGLSKPRLAELGLGALLHDLALDDSGGATAARHPVDAVVALAGACGLERVPRAVAAACFEHHLPRPATLTGRIVAIADAYDA